MVLEFWYISAFSNVHSSVLTCFNRTLQLHSFFIVVFQKEGIELICNNLLVCQFSVATEWSLSFFRTTIRLTWAMCNYLDVNMCVEITYFAFNGEYEWFQLIKNTISNMPITQMDWTLLCSIHFMNEVAIDNN